MNAIDTTHDRAHANLRALWPELRQRVPRMGPFYAVGVVTPEGPNVLPIGSVLLGEPGEGYCFEIFASALTRAGEGARVCVLAVDSRPLFWLAALARGRFPAPPAYRLDGVLGVRRPSTAEERERWLRRVRAVRWLPGHQLLWGRLDHVRELHFTGVRTVRLGRMTAPGSPAAPQPAT